MLFNLVKKEGLGLNFFLRGAGFEVGMVWCMNADASTRSITCLEGATEEGSREGV